MSERSEVISDNVTLTMRSEAKKTDPLSVKSLLVGTGFFSEAEIQVGVELVEERLLKGEESGYHFLFLEETEGLRTRVVGYICFGEIPCTTGSYDLYWVAVERSRQASGYGSRLMIAMEEILGKIGGRAIYAETSGRAQYQPTHAFYLKHGYSEAARFPDFYARGDAKIVYSKEVPRLLPH